MNRREIVAAFVACLQQGVTRPAFSEDAQSGPALSARLLAHAPAIGERGVGLPEAPVTVVEYASATCPHCAQFHIHVLPRILRTYVDAGKVRWIFREFPLDSLAMAAFMMARCLPPDRYFPAIGLLFERQKEWAAAETDARQSLFGVASALGLDQKGFDACLRRKDLAEGIYAVAKTGHAEFKVKSTPTFFINGRLVRGVQDFAAFSALIDAELANPKTGLGEAVD
jgi:protein-disulfide isomerase